MKEQWTKLIMGVKGFWGKLSKKGKIIAIAAAGAVVVAAVIITVALNAKPPVNQMVALYPNNTPEQSLEVYNTLQGMEENINATLDPDGKVLVSPQDRDRLLLALSQQGYVAPSSPYGTFLTNSGFTQTEMEKKVVLIFQTQELLMQTINSIEGVKSSSVLITIPDDNNYVWNDQQQNSTASVTMTMKQGEELTPERVTGIKNLVAYSVPKMAPENVRVINGSTGVDMEDEGSANGMSTDRLDFERQMEQGIVNKIKELLYPIYNDGVTAVATVKLNYDTVKEETQEFIPKDDGSGYTTSDKEDFTVDGSGNTVGGIVGEQNNTDTPGYAALEGNADGQGVNRYGRDREIDYGKKIVQTERGPAAIDSLSVSVLVPEPNFTDELRDRYTQMITTGVDVEADRLTVETYETIAAIPPVEDEQTTPAITQIVSFIQQNWIWFAIGALVLILLLVALFIILSKLKRKKKMQMEVVEEQAEDIARNAQREIEAHKKALAEAAQGDGTDAAITNEVREFAKQNPEITAQLIRTMLKEEE